MSYRIERDLLGEMEVPKDAYYGIHTVRALKNFPVSGFKIPEELIVALAQVKEACTRANIKTGLLDERIGNAIIDAAREIQEGNLHCLATALAPYIGHEKAGELSQKAQLERKQIREVAIESGLFTDEELDIIFSPQELTRPGIPGEKRLKKRDKHG
ncbi:MAG TPA: lyase family protein [Syntrophorhabdaceae bacterium]|nr:lyase family protein [Syntrophorhabdaceae bacterium]